MDLSIFKNRLKLQLRYDDLDTYGHVNNKVFLSFLEEGRINYINELNIKKYNIFDFGAVVGRIDIKYTAPLHFGDEAWVYTRCSRIGNKSYDLQSVIVKKQDGEEIISAIANVTMVSYDLKSGKSKPNDPKMYEIISEYEIIPPLKE